MGWNKNLNFTSKTEIEEFERDLDAFQAMEGAPTFSWLKLSSLWCVDKPSDIDRRIFVCALDLRLNVSCLEIELSQIAKVSHAADKNPEKNGYESFKCFQLNTSYITRYRAIYDKIMGILVLVFRPDKYDKFSGANRKRKAFVSIMSEIGGDYKYFATKLSDSIGRFDSAYRTAEVHGSGGVRKWNFEMIYGPFGNQADMFWSWNTLHPMLTALGKILLERK